MIMIFINHSKKKNQSITNTVRSIETLSFLYFPKLVIYISFFSYTIHSLLRVISVLYAL